MVTVATPNRRLRRSCSSHCDSQDLASPVNPMKPTIGAVAASLMQDIQERGFGRGLDLVSWVFGRKSGDGIG